MKVLHRHVGSAVDMEFDATGNFVLTFYIVK